MRIYNIWGILLFETFDSQIGWDGTFEGKSQDAGNYAYFVRVIDNHGEEKIKKGFTALAR